MFVGMLAALKVADPTLLSFAILLFIVWFLKPMVHKAWMVRKIPGPPGIPIVGNVHLFFGLNNEQLHNKFCELGQTYGTLILFRFFNKIVVTISNPVDAQTVMMNSKLRNRDPILETVVNTFIDNSFFTLRDEAYTARRKLVNSAFRFQIVVTYLEGFALKADQLAKKFAFFADGRTVDIIQDMCLCTLSGLGETALGVKNNMDGELVKDLFMQFEEARDLSTARFFNPLHWPLWLYHLSDAGKTAKRNSQKLFDFIDEHVSVIWERQKRRSHQEQTSSETGERRLQTYVDVLIENSMRTGIEMPVSHLRSDILALAAGASETCAGTMSLLLMLLGIYDEYQERLVEEQRAVFGDSLRPVQNEDILAMPFLDMCIKETLRLFPPIPLMPRHISFDLPISKGITLPAGTMVVFNAFNVHRNPANYVDPDKFWPERWLPEHSIGRHTHAYIPYGGGNRNCIAIKYSQFQMKATLSRLLREFKFSCDFTMADLNRLEYKVFMKPMCGFKVRMLPRKRA